MSRLSLPALAMALLLAPAAQAQDHSGHGGHGTPPATSDADRPVSTDRPAAPGDHAADAYYDPAEMARAREQLRYEAGGMPNSKLMIDLLEWRPGRSGDGYAWEVEGWIGGDLDRLAVKSKGEGIFGGRAEEIEVQAGWFHALDPWFNLRLGARQDLQAGPRRTHAVLAIEGLAPYWFEVEGELFLSHKGEVTARGEASYDQRLTQRLILQPRIEVNLSAQRMRDLEIGSGISSVETGLRLRYEIVREFAPYVGVNWERRTGETARLVRAHGEDVSVLRAVVGIRSWF